MTELEGRIKQLIIEAADSRMHSSEIAALATPRIMSLLAEREGPGLEEVDWPTEPTSPDRHWEREGKLYEVCRNNLDEILVKVSGAWTRPNDGKWGHWRMLRAAAPSPSDELEKERHRRMAVEGFNETQAARIAALEAERDQLDVFREAHRS